LVPPLPSGDCSDIFIRILNFSNAPSNAARFNGKNRCWIASSFASLASREPSA
jgi:hypothetical protein